MPTENAFKEELARHAREMGWIRREDGTYIHEDDVGPVPTIFDGLLDLYRSTLRYATARR